MMLSCRGDETGKQKRQQRGGERERGGMKTRMKTRERAKRADEKKAGKHGQVQSSFCQHVQLCHLFSAWLARTHRSNGQAILNTSLHEQHRKICDLRRSYMGRYGKLGRKF